MSTKGDEVLDRALYKIGDKSLFTKVGIISIMPDFCIQCI